MKINIKGLLVVGQRGKLIAFMPEDDKHGLMIARNFTNAEAQKTKSRTYKVILSDNKS